MSDRQGWNDMCVPQGWHMSSIKDHVTNCRGGAPLAPNDFVAEGVAVIPKKAVDASGTANIPTSEQSYSSKTFAAKHSRSCIHGDTYLATTLRDLVPTGPTIGLIVRILNGSYILAQGVYGFELKPSLDPSLLVYLSQTSQHRQQMRAMMVGSTQVHIRTSEFFDASIPVPPLLEQQKIARILTTVDNLIEKTEALIEKYKSIKQGMMHDLFTRGVDYTDRLRPPYDDAPHLYKQSPLGWIPKEWEVGALSTIANLVGGFAFSSVHARENGVRWLKIANVGFEKANWSNISYLPYGFLSIHTDFSLNPGDMVIAMTRPIIRGALKIAVLTNEDTPALLNQRVGRLDVQRSEDSRFVYFAIQLPHTIEQLENKTLGTDPPNLSSSQVESSIIQIPPPDERIRIAERLSSISSKLEAERRYCSRLLTLKTGLMQDLLIGKVRVNVDDAEQSNHTIESVCDGVGI